MDILEMMVFKEIVLTPDYLEEDLDSSDEDLDYLDEGPDYLEEEDNRSAVKIASVKHWLSPVSGVSPI
jgi:hypothetical protein